MHCWRTLWWEDVVTRRIYSGGEARSERDKTEREEKRETRRREMYITSSKLTVEEIKEKYENEENEHKEKSRSTGRREEEERVKWESMRRRDNSRLGGMGRWEGNILPSPYRLSVNFRLGTLELRSRILTHQNRVL